MNLIKKNLSNIIISLIIGILTFYLQPILEYIGKVVVNYFNLASDTFSNYYYSIVAENDPYTFEGLTNYLLILLFGIVLLLIYITFSRLIHGQELKIQSRIKEIGRQKKFTEKATKDEGVTDEEFWTNIRKMENISQNSLLIIDNNKKRLKLMIIITAVLMIVLLSNYAFKITVTTENTKFRNKTIILLPILGQEKINELKSSWALMENSNDYNRIIEEVNRAEKMLLKNRNLKKDNLE